MNTFKLQIKNNLSLVLLIALPFVCIIVGSFFSYFAYSETILRYNKTISLVNLYKIPVTITIDEGTETYLDPFEIKYLELKTKDEVKLVIKDNENNPVETILINETVRPAHLNIRMLTKEQNFCFFKADVTDFYYSDDSKPIENPTLKDVKLIQTERPNIVLHEFNEKELTIFPGYSTIKDVEKNISKDNKALGVYPIECENLENTEKQIETVLFYKNYNAKEQSKYYFENVERINNLTL